MPLSLYSRPLARIAAAGLLALVVASVARGQKEKPLDVSLMQIIASPEKYNERLVRVVGFLAFGFEGDWLYLHKEDYENGIDADAVWVERTKPMYHDIEKLDEKYVLIVGVFRNEGPKFGYPAMGHIVNIEKCELWSDPNHPRTERLRQMQEGGQQRQPPQ